MNAVALVVVFLVQVSTFSAKEVQVPIRYYFTVQDCIQDVLKLTPEMTREYDYWCKEVTIEDGYAVWENE